jgi:hypothetical protein
MQPTAPCEENSGTGPPLCQCRSKLPRDDQRSIRGENGESGFTYGVLVANELNRAAEIRATLRK